MPRKVANTSPKRVDPAPSAAVKQNANAAGSSKGAKATMENSQANRETAPTAKGALAVSTPSPSSPPSREAYDSVSPPNGNAGPQQALTRTQKRMQKEKARKEEKKRLATEAGVDLFPKDPLANERREILSNIQNRIQSMPDLAKMQPSDILAAFQQQKREIDEIESSIHSALGDESHKVKRPEAKKTSACLLAQKITDMIKSGDGESDAQKSHIEWLTQQLAVTVCWENHKKFQTTLQDLLPGLQEKKKVIARTADGAREMEKKIRNKERLKAIMQLNNSEREIGDLEIVSQKVDFPAETCQVIFNIIQRKLERMFEVVIEPWAMGTAPGGRGQGIPARSRSRGGIVWGEADKVTACVDFLKLADFSGKGKIPLDRYAAMALIGKGGTCIRKLEEETGCIINIDSRNEASAYGYKENIVTAIKKIQNIQTETELLGQTLSISDVATYLAKGLHSLMYQHIKSVETEQGVNVRVQFGTQGANDSVITIKGKLAAIQSAKLVIEGLMKRLKVEEVFAEKSVALRLYGSGDRGSDPNPFAAEFGALRESCRVSISKEATDEVDQTRLVVVGEEADVAHAKDALQGLLDRASVKPLQIQISREQLRILTTDARHDIEMSTGAQLNVIRPREANTVTIQLIGSESEKKEAAAAVQEIIEKRGCSEEISYLSDNTKVQLIFQNKGQRLQEIECRHSTSISMSREAKTMKIVGTAESVAACKSEILQIDSDNVAREANMETLEIPLAPGQAALVIGKKGATIRHIEATSKVDKITIQDSMVVVRGAPSELAIAENMINEKLNDTDNNGNMPSGGGERIRTAAPRVNDGEQSGGRLSGGASQSYKGNKKVSGGDTAPGSKGATSGKTSAAATVPAPNRFCELNFPTLDASMTTKGNSRRHGWRRSGAEQGSPSGAGDADGEKTDSASTPSNSEGALNKDDLLGTENPATEEPQSLTPASDSFSPAKEEELDEPHDEVQLDMADPLASATNDLVSAAQSVPEDEEFHAVCV